jgi:hypothetical protein
LAADAAGLDSSRIANVAGPWMRQARQRPAFAALGTERGFPMSSVIDALELYFRGVQA